MRPGLSCSCSQGRGNSLLSTSNRRHWSFHSAPECWCVAGIVRNLSVSTTAGADCRCSVSMRSRRRLCTNGQPCNCRGCGTGYICDRDISDRETICDLRRANALHTSRSSMAVLVLSLDASGATLLPTCGRNRPGFACAWSFRAEYAKVTSGTRTTLGSGGKTRTVPKRPCPACCKKHRNEEMS